LDETTPTQEYKNSWIKLKIKKAPPPTLTMLTYGYMTEIACQAALTLAYDYEIFTEIMLTPVLLPFNVKPILSSIRQTKKILTIEEGNLTLGWGAEIIARIINSLGEDLQQAKRIAALDLPIPASSTLENLVLPSIDRIVQTALKVV
jgi:pyruvate/2-oxoglutarate/acetoin dehydrogenase E1 component